MRDNGNKYLTDDELTELVKQNPLQYNPIDKHAKK
jgi:hypothetical protein